MLKKLLLIPLMVLVLTGFSRANDILDISRSELTNDVSVQLNTVTTVLTHTLIMPNGGCPCSVIAYWNIQTQTPAISSFEGFVNDGFLLNNVFAGSASMMQPGGVDGFSGSGISNNIYTNGQTVTFLLQVRSYGTNALAVPGSVPRNVSTHLQTVVVRN